MTNSGSKFSKCRSVRTQIQLAMAVVVGFSMLVVILLAFKSQRKALIQQFQLELLHIVNSTAIFIDGDAHQRINSNNFLDSDDFKKLREQLIEVKAVNMLAEEIYTLRYPIDKPKPKMLTPGEELEFVVMSNDLPEEELFVGDRYYVREEMLQTFEEGKPNATKLYVDQHGAWISAYAPVKNSNGEVVAILEADYRADNYFDQLQQDMLLMGAIAVVSVLLSLILGSMLARKISKPLESLTSAATYISDSHFDHEIKIDNSTRELHDLTSAFDDMRGNLNQNINELKQVREELLRKERLSTIGQMASTIIHDLRNPMGVIMASTGVLKMDVDDEMRGKMIQMIEKKIEQLNGMISDLLEFSKGEVKLNPQPMALCDFIDEQVETFKLQLDGKKVEIESNVEQKVDVKIDRDRLSRSIGNLVTNAVEAMGKTGGKVRLDGGSKNGSAIIKISDNGPGIPKKIQKNLFDAFVTSGKPNGTGLGTSIARHIVEAHGGSISFTSIIGQGTEFEIMLPREA